MTLAAAGGPTWTDILTAIGTVGAVIVALGIALYTDWRSGGRIKAEHERSDEVLREERERAAAELAGQREHERAALDDERAYSRQQLEEERRLALEREQFAEAYAVQVVFGERDPGLAGVDAQGRRNPSASELRQLAVMVVNRGSYTITKVEAQFCMGSAIVPHDRYIRLSGADNLAVELRSTFESTAERTLYGVLAPWDTGIRFETDSIHGRQLAGWYPIVRWADRWGTPWEHRKGVVRRINDGQPWEP